MLVFSCLQITHADFLDWRLTQCSDFTAAIKTHLKYITSLPLVWVMRFCDNKKELKTCWCNHGVLVMLKSHVSWSWFNAFFWEVLFLRSTFSEKVPVLVLGLNCAFQFTRSKSLSSFCSILRLFAQFPFIWLSDCSRVSVLNQDNGIENDTIIRKATSSCTNLWPNGGRAMQIVLNGPHSTHLESVRPFLANILFGKCLLADTLCTFMHIFDKSN